MLCFARVSCLPHRSCLVPFLAPSQGGKTAFHFAAENGHVAAMEFLLAHGADPKAKDWVRAPLEAFWLEKKGREGEGGRAARGPVMRGAQTRMSRPHKPCARHDARNHMKLEK